MPADPTPANLTEAAATIAGLRAELVASRASDQYARSENAAARDLAAARVGVPGRGFSTGPLDTTTWLCDAWDEVRAALTAAQAEADEMRAWAATAAKAENENARDLEVARQERDNARRTAEAAEARHEERSRLLSRALARADEARAEASRLDALVNAPGECNSILKLRAERDELALTLANERGEGAGPSEGWEWSLGTWQRGVEDCDGQVAHMGHGIDGAPPWEWCAKVGGKWIRGRAPTARAAMLAADAALKAGGSS